MHIVAIYIFMVMMMVRIVMHSYYACVQIVLSGHYDRFLYCLWHGIITLCLDGGRHSIVSSLFNHI